MEPPNQALGTNHFVHDVVRGLLTVSCVYAPVGSSVQHVRLGKCPCYTSSGSSEATLSLLWNHPLVCAVEVHDRAEEAGKKSKMQIC